MTTSIHALHGVVELPRRFNNPFHYQPDALCQKAMEELTAYLEGNEAQTFAPDGPTETFREEIAQGKMFGVLVVSGPEGIGYLAGYSGQIGGRSDWPGFVPAVFDYLQPDGHFKQEEAEIVALNEQLKRLGAEEPVLPDAPVTPRPAQLKGRQQGESEEQYIHRRQFEKAELHRWKLRERERMAVVEEQRRQKEEKVSALRTLRRQKSDRLQTWLFRRFVMCNGRGEHRDLIDVFGADGPLPPAGSGECCEPKMLQYALQHGLRPVSMAMFWWGESPKSEVRHHLQCYPACRGKCRPILKWMMQGMDVEPDTLEETSHQTLRIVYEDAAVCVVDKPAGMLSVDGKSGADSVQQMMRRRFPQATGPLIVHRLDMATSGLMVIALRLDVYIDLQRQFARREITKRYVALLERAVSQPCGDIELPLRPDLDDRPRQMVDEQFGKPAFTHYERMDDRRVALYPRTGRTHQLRMHCAHRDGLDNPIVGDALYGRRADRLCLHAEQLTFRHPYTGEVLTFTSPAPF